MTSAWVRLGIPSIALALSTLFVFAVWTAERSLGSSTARARRRAAFAALGAALWLTAMACAAESGLLARFDLRPPPMAGWFLSTLSIGAFLGRSALGARLALGLPLWALVGVQGFRLPLELLMHRAAQEGVMPSVMSYSGYNFDILTGISALVLLPGLLRQRVPLWLVRAWNYLGLTLLAVVASVAFAATPLFHAFGEQQLNLWITQFPYVWMAVMVASALAGHLLVARRLTLEASDHPRVARGRSPLEPAPKH